MVLVLYVGRSFFVLEQEDVSYYDMQCMCMWITHNKGNALDFNTTCFLMNTITVYFLLS
jgi:hypothetical protein